MFVAPAGSEMLPMPQQRTNGRKRAVCPTLVLPELSESFDVRIGLSRMQRRKPHAAPAHARKVRGHRPPSGST